MNKLSELLTSLSGHEVRQFRSYIASPYFNTRKEVEQAFEAAVVSLKDSDNLDKAIVYKKAVQTRRYNDKQWRYLQSDLSMHLENFLTLKYLQSDQKEFDSIALKTLSVRNCSKAWQHYYLNTTSDKSRLNGDHFLHLFKASENKLSFEAKRQSRKKSFDYQQVLNHLDTFYLSKKLQLFSEVMNLKNILRGEYDLRLYEELKKTCREPLFLKTPAVQVYYHVLMTLTEPAKEEHFKTLQSLVLQHEAIFPPEELGDLFQYIKNYCIRKLNEGNTEYTEVLFSIYKSILANKRLMNYDYLSQFEFKNIVSISLRLEEKEWCRKFIKKYIAYLPPAERSNAMKYNMAFWHFHAGDFRMAIKMLQEVSFTDVVYQLDSRVILLKSYFEQDDEEHFFYHASAFRLFLLRNRYISDYQKKFNRNLIKFLTAIARAGTSRTKLKKLREEIVKEKNVADIKWLLQKVDDR